MADTDTSVEGQKIPVKNLFLSHTHEWNLYAYKDECIIQIVKILVNQKL